MRIAFLTGRFLPHSVGGGETHTYHLAKALMARGHDVEILLASDLRSEADFGYEWEALKIFHCPADSGPPDQLYPSAARPWLEQFLQARRIDVIHVMVSGSCNDMIASAVEIGIPIVVTLLDFHYWCPITLVKSSGDLCSGPKSLQDCHRCVLKPHPRLSRLQAIWAQFPTWIREQILRFPPESLAYIELQWKELEQRAHFFRNVLAPRAVFIAPSKIMRRLAEANGVEPARVLDMAYGVPESFARAPRLKTPSSVLRIGYFGRLAYEKGVHVLVKAVCNLPADVRIRLLVYGANAHDAPQYVQHVGSLAERDKRIEFCPVVTQEQLSRIHHELDLVVIPSMWHENATIVLLESLALGTPVVVSDVEGMSPFVKNAKNGFRVPAGDVATLSNTLLWCADHPDAVAKMAGECYPVLTVEKQAECIEDTYVTLRQSSEISLIDDSRRKAHRDLSTKESWKKIK